MKALKVFGCVVGIILLVFLVAYTAIGVVVYTSVGKIPTAGAKYPAPHIRELIWPTIGYPAMVAPGSSLEVEVDLPGQDTKIQPVQDTRMQPEQVSPWSAVLKPARKALSGLSYQLTSRKVWRAASTKWPAGSRGGHSSDVWHAEFPVPAEAVPELYDISVEVVASGRTVTDTQAHSVGIFEGKDNNFTFLTLADIHVHERDISKSTPHQPQTNHGITPDGQPEFFRRAIDQVNLIRPDFVLMLGDLVYAQARAGEYQVEFERFFHELSRFEVPVFAVPGNHDLYINEVNGARVWEENLGPLHYSFDVGDCHLTALNSSDWPAVNRVVMIKPGRFVYPLKWQGQVLSAKDEEEVSTYSGQLAWARDDLASHGNSKLRLMLYHHDPFRPGGKGIAYKNERLAIVYSLGGGGTGKIALKTLASKYRVNMVFTGHQHSDYVGRARWDDGAGETVYANQTCVYFDQGGMAESYPGYRLMKVRNGRIEDISYLDGYHSIPIYDGSVLKGETDLDRLERPAIRGEGPVITAAQGYSATITSYLGITMELRGLVMTAPYSQGGYSVSGGEVYRTVSIPGQDNNVLLYVKTTAGEGVPGASATKPGTPNMTEVTFSPK